jgi:hypothetical protein
MNFLQGRSICGNIRPPEKMRKEAEDFASLNDFPTLKGMPDTGLKAENSSQ